LWYELCDEYGIYVIDRCNSGKFKITNNFLFTDLSDFKLVYKIIKDGKQTFEGQENINIKPNSSDILKLSFDFLKKFKDNPEYYVEFSLELKVDTIWVKKVMRLLLHNSNYLKIMIIIV